MLVLTRSQVRDLLPMRDCMEVVGEALSALARGEGLQPLRGGFLLPDRSGVLAGGRGKRAGQSMRQEGHHAGNPRGQAGRHR